MTKKLIVNADDWGMSPRFNEGILRGIIAGTITSTTVMADRPFVRHELATLKECDVSIGLHFELPEEKTGQASEELERQFKTFKEIFGREPTHLDGHKHRHLLPEVFPKVIEFALQHSLPVRARYSFDCKTLRNAGIKTTDYFIDPIGKNDFERTELVRGAQEGTTEWMAHPGFFDSERKAHLNREREEELNFLMSEDFKRVLAEEDIMLIDWREI